MRWVGVVWVYRKETEQEVEYEIQGAEDQGRHVCTIVGRTEEKFPDPVRVEADSQQALYREVRKRVRQLEEQAGHKNLLFTGAVWTELQS